MREIELKILEIDRERAVSTLLSLGAVMTFDDEIHALYYDMPGQSLKERHTTLRLQVLQFRPERFGLLTDAWRTHEPPDACLSGARGCSRRAPIILYFYRRTG